VAVEPDDPEEKMCAVCVRHWLDTFAVLDALRTGDKHGAYVVLGAADATEVAMQLGRVAVVCLDSEDWKGVPLKDMVASYRRTVLQRERDQEIGCA
jgi:3-dehydroquinate synthase class II